MGDNIQPDNTTIVRPFPKGWGFERPVDTIDQLPPPDLVEIAFAGRSNVGKSSLISSVCSKEKLARSSNTPGRTQSLNLFLCDADLRIVDMPGYGYARAPKTKVVGWTKLIHAYLLGRPNLRCAYLLIDSRHGLKANDLSLMAQLDIAAVTYRIVLTKTDKIPSIVLQTLHTEMIEAVRKHAACAPEIFATSTKYNNGIQDLRDDIARLLA